MAHLLIQVLKSGTLNPASMSPPEWSTPHSILNVAPLLAVKTWPFAEGQEMVDVGEDADVVDVVDEAFFVVVEDEDFGVVEEDALVVELALVVEEAPVVEEVLELELEEDDFFVVVLVFKVVDDLEVEVDNAHVELAVAYAEIGGSAANLGR